MERFRLAAAAAGFISIALAVMDTLYPSEKFEKQLKIIVGLIFTLCIIKPFTDGSIDIKTDWESAEMTTAEIYGAERGAFDFFSSSVESNLEARLTELLEDSGYLCKDIQTSINISDDGRISINEIEITFRCEIDSAAKKRAVELVAEQVGKDVAVTIKEQAYETE